MAKSKEKMPVYDMDEAIKVVYGNISSELKKNIQ